MKLYVTIRTAAGWEIESVDANILRNMYNDRYCRYEMNKGFYGNIYPLESIYTTETAARAYINKDYFTAKQARWNPAI